MLVCALCRQDIHLCPLRRSWVWNSDADGDVDVVLAVYPTTGVPAATPVRFYRNTGSPTSPVFDAGHIDLEVSVAGFVTTLQVVDLNNDGLLDLVYGSISSVHVYKQRLPPHPMPPHENPVLVRAVLTV